MNKGIFYGRQWIDGQDIKEVVKVLGSDRLTQGPCVQEFEERLCAYTGAKYAVAVSSGTAALHIACLAAGIKPGHEVITSPVTFIASANCILYCAGTPVFADIDRETVNIAPAEILKRITKRTKAILPVHFAGHPCDLENIARIAKRRNLLVIEDAAHALGAKYKGSPIGSCKYSDMTTLSFHPVKSITTGEGGAVLTNRKDLRELLMSYRNHGIVKDIQKMEKNEGPWYYEMQRLGFNYRITDFQCALGLNQLRKLDRFVKKRDLIASAYNKSFSCLPGVALPVHRPGVKHAWHLYIIRFEGAHRHKRRKQAFDLLKNRGIIAQVHYIPVYKHPYYRQRFNFKPGDYPAAEQYYSEAISLPIYPAMTDKDIAYVVDSFTEIADKLHYRGTI